jgi:hypothetical protein
MDDVIVILKPIVAEAATSLDVSLTPIILKSHTAVAKHRICRQYNVHMLYISLNKYITAAVSSDRALLQLSYTSKYKAKTAFTGLHPKK